MLKTYKELMSFDTYSERLNYLRLRGSVGQDTFGFDRIFNQKFYRSEEWKQVRRHVIVRDMGCDLGIEDRPILGKVLIHHMNPISLSDIENSTDILLKPEFLICVSHDTHNSIHYGTSEVVDLFHERQPNDMCPWR